MREGFGESGDKQLVKFKRFVKNWKMLEESLDVHWHERQETVTKVTPKQQKVYVAQYNDIMSHVTRQIDDTEKNDRMIALRLRATGHKENEIATIISACRKKDRKYGVTIAKEVFGEYGDKELGKYWKFVSNWRILEQNKIMDINNDSRKLYNTHFNDIVRLTKKPNMDQEKIDGMIAVRLRATGHKQQEVAKVIAAGRQKDKEYTQRIIENAFSDEANKQIKKYSKFIKEWKMLDESLNLKWYQEKE